MRTYRTGQHQTSGTNEADNTQIVSEMSYADGVHRQVLFTVGLVLYIFIMIINLIITFMQKKGEKANG